MEIFFKKKKKKIKSSISSGAVEETETESGSGGGEPEPNWPIIILVLLVLVFVLLAGMICSYLNFTSWSETLNQVFEYMFCVFIGFLGGEKASKS